MKYCEELEDLTCLAENCVFPVDFNQTGINLNELIVGPTGGGKTFSTVYPRLLHTFNSSLVVPISKKAVKVRFAKLFEERGYKVIDIDLSNSNTGAIGYDPMLHVKSESEMIQLARNIVMNGEETEKSKVSDPYWQESAVNVLAAEMLLAKQNAEYMGRKCTMKDVLMINEAIRIGGSEVIRINMSDAFDRAGEMCPDSSILRLWSTVKCNAPRTAACILSYVNSSLGRTFSNEIISVMEAKKQIDFTDIGQRKTICFLTTSPMKQGNNTFMNILYADLIRELFELAESKQSGRLQVPVQIICDDFAVSGRIANFENYISIFRAAGIGVSLLLQSESQLKDMYGSVGATTIMNNCDSYLYMGGMDITTCESIAKRINKPLDKVMSLPLEQVILFRRGQPPYMGRRYQTLADYLWKLNFDCEVNDKNIGI